ncbi:unnamed protein product [Toxocara canis]|uniref:AraC family transcriptional regulator n=1 Tax=Toxocara canis TaxID=6265 RepID=A0A183TZA0_TOXCA|nr:unnamed protein product [Toxocara canis]
MLRSFVTASELSEAFDLTTGSPYLLPIHYSIRHELQGVFPEAKCSIFGYPYHNPQMWMIIRRNQFTRPHVFMASRTQLFITESDIDAFLMLTLPYLLELSEFSARILGIQLSTRMSELFSSHFDFSAPSYLSNYFLISETKQRLISKMTIQLAEGYEFTELDPDVRLKTKR